MSGDPCEDPASAVIDVFRTAMLQAFDPESDCPPAGGGSIDVRFIAGDGALPSWNPDGKGCKAPFLWVRVAHRYRSRSADFPAAFVGTTPCSDTGLVRVLAVEVGVGRCVSREAAPRREALDREAEISLDDSWRIERVLCVASGRLRKQKPPRASASDTVAPYGPEGGITAWTGMAYVQF